LPYHPTQVHTDARKKQYKWDKSISLSNISMNEQDAAAYKRGGCRYEHHNEYDKKSILQSFVALYEAFSIGE